MKTDIDAIAVLEKAKILLQSIREALARGTKHYNKAGGLLLTEAAILDALITDGAILFTPNDCRQPGIHKEPRIINCSKVPGRDECGCGCSADETFCADAGGPPNLFVAQNRHHLDYWLRSLGCSPKDPRVRYVVAAHDLRGRRGGILLVYETAIQRGDFFEIRDVATALEMRVVEVTS